MFDSLYPVLILLLVVGVVWVLLKFMLKLTVKIFSWGCLMIFILGVVLFAIRGIFFGV
jgi:hypothetical protein